ncbi:EAL domain-containing protein [Deinococcus maricopensis]|uniref:Diguanylate cyclase/phosphodiesterase n=1 Tax=Deinococcus maricopensis (strain DSM 21211 / LMG 22137 / NRRL B-23946 / LB-34) TaxID=709986 RepID=E8U4G4_DEIML|nr:EAL domain-containing protein [Deinococcus maricopensis]ADV68829.1 diguanylate cyclase/phosphodiesterase [Deinococcus maricopensis DSM 21211]
MSTSTAPLMTPAPDEAARVAALLRDAEALILVDAPRASALAQDAQVAAQALCDVALESLAWVLHGASLYFRSRFVEARDAYHRALDLGRRAGDGALQARALNGLGITEERLGDYGSAMELFLESLRVAQEHGDERGRLRVLSNIAVTHAELGEYDRALQAHLEIIDAARVVGDRVIESSAMANAVVDHYTLGAYEQALAVADEHIATLRDARLPQHEVVVGAYRALTLLDLGRAADALDAATALLPLVADVGDYDYICHVHITLGRAHHALGTFDAAEAHLRAAVDAAGAHTLRLRERDAHHHLSDLCAARGDWHAAYSHMRAYHDLERALHAQDVDRKTKVLSAQMQVEMLRREAEVERRRSQELAAANTALQEAQQHLAHRATHDALTGLANRAHFHAEVERALAERGESAIAVLFIDLDRFKHINDTLGHDVGDELLREVARRLRANVRAADLVARMGGDEFTLLLRDLHDERDAERVARKLLTALTGAFELRGQRLFVTASIGVALAPRDGLDVTTLQKHADIAMYRAKQSGKNGVRTFAASMGEQETEQLDLERDLRAALHGDELRLHYQGQFDVATGTLNGFEALVRWQHPRLGLVPPAKFIPIAETTELIVPLGAWVLREACRQASAWGANERGFTVSVNVSAVQFDRPDFVTTVVHALQDSRLRGECLILELTESLVLRDPDRAIAQIEQLRALGVRVALDDFGTGQSSLAVLRRLPLDFLKIDRSFMNAATPEERVDATLLVGVMITLAHGLNLHVTAEGVETGEQRDLLHTLGCDSVQGYLLARPVPPADAAALLNASISRSA